MLNQNSVIAELFGLALFDLKRLAAFQQQHEVGQDLLEALTTTDLGKQVSEEGIAIPITGIPGEYYHVAIRQRASQNRCLSDEQIIIRSSGWILESVTGEIIVCGIGYFKQFKESVFTDVDKFIRLPIALGWNEVEIVGGIDEKDRLIYELITNPVSVKPVFSGNFEDSFALLY